jgi:hypothetical protein
MQPPIQEESERAKRARALNMISAARAANRTVDRYDRSHIGSSAHFGSASVNASSKAFQMRNEESRAREDAAKIAKAVQEADKTAKDHHEEKQRRPWHQ